MRQPKYWTSFTGLFNRRRFFFLVFTTLFFLVHRQYFTIRQITCLAENGLCSSEVSSILSKNLGASLVYLDKTKIRSEIRQISKPDSILIKQKIPNTLIVNLVFPSFQAPLNVLVSDFQLPTDENSGRLLTETFSQNGFSRYSLTLNGDLLDSHTDSSVNLITPDLEDKSALVKLAQLLQSLNSWPIIYTSIYAVPPVVIIYLSPSQQVVMSLDLSPENQLLTLQQILTTATIKDSRYIDLRFNRPIIK